MNDITIFNHLGNNIRVTTNEQGETPTPCVEQVSVAIMRKATYLSSNLDTWIAK